MLPPALGDGCACEAGVIERHPDGSGALYCHRCGYETLAIDTYGGRPRPWLTASMTRTRTRTDTDTDPPAPKQTTPPKPIQPRRDPAKRRLNRRYRCETCDTWLTTNMVAVQQNMYFCPTCRVPKHKG